MALARVTYTQSVSGNKNFSVPFPYISRDHVQVTVNGSAVTFTWNNASTVSLAVAPAVGAKVEVRRTTEKTNLLVDFKDGSTITETDLDTLARQNFFLSQEADDLAVASDAVANEAKDAANTAVSTANTALSTANSAVSTANSAVATANSATSTANTAATNASNAVATANAAATSASNAVDTANAAATSASNAVTTANAANSTANSAASQAASAVTTADSASSSATTALNTANTALANSEAAVSLANFASLKADSAEAAAQSAAADAQSAAADASTAVTTSQQLEVTVNQVLADVQAIAGGDLSDFAKNSENLSNLVDKAAARFNLGLGNVENTADLDKPVSTATQAAITNGLATKANASHTHSKSEITDLSLTWGDVTGKPSTFTPSAHTHPVGELTGLGTAATANVTTSKLDTVEGKVLRVGDFGLGASTPPVVTNIDDKTLKPGTYYYGDATQGSRPSPYGVLLVTSYAAGGSTNTWANQVAFATDGKVWTRFSTNLEAWSSWREIYHNGNLNWDALTGKPSTFPPSGHTHPLSQITGGTTYGQFVIGGTASDWSWPNGLEVRERSGLGATVSAWQDAPRLTFHWGSRHVKNIGLRSDGLMAVNDDPIALYSNLAGKASTSGGHWLEHLWAGDGAGPFDLYGNWGHGIFYVEFGAGSYRTLVNIISTETSITLAYSAGAPPTFNDGALSYNQNTAVTFRARNITAANKADHRIKNIWRLARTN